MKKLRSAVIGTGFIGTAHVEALRRLGLSDVVAIADVAGAQQKAETMGIPHAFSDYREMLDTLEPDVVHICTPNNTHLEMTLYAFQKKMHVVCEKPMNCNTAESIEMVKAMRDTGLVGAVNYHNRFYPMTRQIKTMVGRGELGRIISIHGEYLQDWLLLPTDYSWRLLSCESGSTRAISDIGTHWMDLAQHVTGLKITEVFAEIKTVYPTRYRPVVPVSPLDSPESSPSSYREIPIDTEDIAIITCRFENGAVGNVMVSQTLPGKKNSMNILVSGTEKSAYWDLEHVEELRIGAKYQPLQLMVKDPVLVNPEVKDLIAYPSGHTEGYPDAIKMNFKSIYAHLLDRSEPVEFATFEDGLREMVLCDTLLDSAHQGRRVRVVMPEILS